MKLVFFGLHIICFFLLLGGKDACTGQDFNLNFQERPQILNNHKIDFDPKDFSNAITLGSYDAPITIVEFTSVSCSHCAVYYTNVFPRLEKEYIARGIVKVISIHFPYDPLAYLAHVIMQGLPPHEQHLMMIKLFQNQSEWLPKDRTEEENKKARSIIMKTLGVPEQSFKISSRIQKNVDAEMENIFNVTQKYGIATTPTFFINGIPFDQELTFENFKKSIDSLR